MATVPTVPTEPAGVIAAAADLNAWAGACTFKLGSAAGNKPMFFLMASTTQSFGTSSGTKVIWSNTAAIFKDNDGGWASGTPDRYTIQTPGYWTFDWTVNAGIWASYLQAWCTVQTTAANPYNPSVNINFQYTNMAQTGSNAFATSGGLCPIYLYPGDYVAVNAQPGAATTSSSNPYSHFTGEWVST